MTDRDRETLAFPWWRDRIAKLGDKPVVMRGYEYRVCTSHPRIGSHTVEYLLRMGFLTLQSEADGVAVYVRAGTGEPKAAWNGGI